MVVGLIVLASVVLFGIGVALYIRLNPQFGGRLSPDYLKQYEASPQWRNGKFENTVETTMDMKPKDIPKMMVAQFTNTKKRRPEHPLPIASFNLATWQINEEIPKYIWYGHATLMLSILGKTILIDPMFGPDASPIGPFSVKRFSENTLSIIDDLPNIDLVVLSHDHYDHLDYDSIKKLKSKVKLFYVALGVERHLERWGIPEHQIKTFDWWDERELDGLKIRFTPSRHFAGRGATDRFKSLWGGWIFKSPQHNIYWSGDGGFGDHFKRIGDLYGPFDLGFMECGQYNNYWRALHMFPDEAVAAAIDAKVKVAIPVHWGGFALSTHLWKAPVESFIDFSQKSSMKYQVPRLGEVIRLDNEVVVNWWEPIN